MCFNKDSSSLLIFCHFSEKYDYLFGLGEKFGQFFWAPIAVNAIKTGLDTSLHLPPCTVSQVKKLSCIFSLLRRTEQKQPYRLLAISVVMRILGRRITIFRKVSKFEGNLTWLRPSKYCDPHDTIKRCNNRQNLSKTLLIVIDNKKNINYGIL